MADVVGWIYIIIFTADVMACEILIMEVLIIIGILMHCNGKEPSDVLASICNTFGLNEVVLEYQ